MKPRRPFWSRYLLPAFALLLGVNLVVLVVWTLPRHAKQRTAEEAARKARAELAGERKQVADLRLRAATIRANRKDSGTFYGSQVDGGLPELLPTIADIEKMARAPGLRPGARSFSRELLPVAPVERVRITLPLEGSYDQLVGFLREIEGSSHFLTIDAVSMHAVEERGAALSVQLSSYLKASPEGRTRGARARR